MESSIDTKALEDSCPVCSASFGSWRRPHIRVPSSSNGLSQLWHLCCFMEEKTEKDESGEQRPLKRRALEAAEDEDFKLRLQEVETLCPDLSHDDYPGLRINCEELNLMSAGKGVWPPVRVLEVPSLVYEFRGIDEFRISACPYFRMVQPKIAQLHGLKNLVFISCNLATLPDEVGQLESLELLFLNGNFLQSLPDAVSKLPCLTQLCVDANLLRNIAPIASPRLEMLTAPGNLLERVPEVSPGCSRLEFHGNRITEFKLKSLSPGLEANWASMLSLKLMGNRLTQLPDELGNMIMLRILLVSNNRLRALPDGIVNLKEIEWLYAYDNAICDLPKHLLKGCTKLDRILLEGNPLSASTLEGLFVDAPCSRVRTLGLDFVQLGNRFHDGDIALPACAKIGNLLGVGGPCEHYYMKHVSWSQLHRALTDPQPSVFSSPEERAECLVVAFSASQAEPEWLGLLSRIARTDHNQLRGLDRPQRSLDSFLADCSVKTLGNATSFADREACLAALWSRCTKPTGTTNEPAVAAQSGDTSLLAFDMVCLVDHRMSWYAADANKLAIALSNVTKHYKHVIFLGASMGGVGAILHGGRLADAVLAFGPQGSFLDATLRPQARDAYALRALTSELHESVRHAHRRGASIEVHCAADDHFWHSLQLPLEDLALTVHPICPRKPFARYLDRCKMLSPILADVFLRVRRFEHSECGRLPIPFGCLSAHDGVLASLPQKEGCEEEANLEKHIREVPLGNIAVACWDGIGGFQRFSAKAAQMLKLFFDYPSPYVPRPGNFYCPKCQFRNKGDRFFCKFCIGVKEANMWLGIKVPNGNVFPRSGDWGCGKCGESMCAYNKTCTSCWTWKWDECNYVVS